MQFAAEGTLPAGVLVGTRLLHSRLQERTDILVIAADEPSMQMLLARAIGEQAAQGGFNITVDYIHQYLNRTSLTGNGQPYQTVIDLLAVTQRRLGSITITGAAFSFVEGFVRSFWIEAAEGARARVIAGDRPSEEVCFSPFEPDFVLDHRQLASKIVEAF